MRKIALVLGCLTHRSLGRTLKTSTPDGQTAQRNLADESHGQSYAVDPTNSLAKLLVAFDPASAFTPRSTSLAKFKPIPKSRCRTKACRMTTSMTPNTDILVDENVAAPADEVQQDLGDETLEQRKAHVKAQIDAVVGDANSKQDLDDETLRKAQVKAQMDAAVIGDANSKIEMQRLKNQEDDSGGLTAMLGNSLVFLDPTKTVRRRLWTRADFMHIHAVSGAYFLSLGPLWLIYSHVVNALDTSVPMETSSWFLTSLLLAGLVNALSAVPMSKFSSNKNFDLSDLKANGFTFGGTGLTIMCLYIAWWFSGDYPDFLRMFDIPIFFFWALVCVGTTVNWEVMLQQNFEANEERGKKGRRKISKEDMDKKAVLYRLASWPNLTQLLFMFSIPFGGIAWLHHVQEIWPMQNTPMYHYGIASAMGYALSMFAETLRDRKLITLDQDLVFLLVGFLSPMVSVVVDGLTYGSAVTISPPEYWALFGFGGV